MKQVYSIGIRLFSFFISFAGVFNKKANEWRAGRKNVLAYLRKKIDPYGKLIWFHCASLGEFEQGRPLIEAFMEKFPQYKVLITFFSPSGYKFCRKYHKAYIISYLPVDTSKNAARFLDLVNPDIAVFIKYEFWFNYIDELSKRNIKFISASAIFHKDQFYFKWYGNYFRNRLKEFSHFYVQNTESAALLKRYGFNNVTVSGDTRFDRVASIALKEKKFNILEKFCNDDHVLIAGSIWKEDEDVIFPFILSGSLKMKTIIAPHEVYESNTLRILKKCDDRAVRYSELTIGNADKFDIVIIDNIGMLSFIYRYAKIAYIGGGFGKGIHNILEAAVFGVPVIFGPKFKTFKEGCYLVSTGGAFTVKNDEEFDTIVTKLLSNPDTYVESSDAARTYVNNNTGATQIIIKGLEDDIKIKAETEKPLLL